MEEEGGSGDSIAELSCLIQIAVIYLVFTRVEGWLTEPFTEPM